ncbi:sirohydrochlorin chelatase [Tessaracoccus sp. MC1756]|uniref:sirohydrochlorin chelatase n=1 Tax=Tessaracoccus sp. MC1756 TaxID=2760311 RepID=UPI0016024035|nr:CbiX/SirB N-terminal domain-containing protein [Tessaracoccus sp. MC1756]MBB1508560.1 sirohydrochlorin chelatase [Tessaracoccus sp. MC1756]
MDIVLIAHGSPDPRHAAAVERIAGAVRVRQPGRRVHTSYLDHHGPTIDDVALALQGRPAVAAPVLLTKAYHARVDIPAAAEALGAYGSAVTPTPPLGPDSRLLAACEEALTAAGVLPDPETAVLVFVAGSSDRPAVTAVADTIAASPRLGWGRWAVAALDGGDAVEEVVPRLRDQAARVVAVSFMVAEGILRDRMVDRCAALGIDMVPGALGDTGAFADLLVARVNGDRTVTVTGRASSATALIA